MNYIKIVVKISRGKLLYLVGKIDGVRLRPGKMLQKTRTMNSKNTNRNYTE